MSGKFFTIREDIIHFLINHDNHNLSMKEFIIEYLCKNLYFEKGIDQYERLTEIHEISKIIKRMEYLGYIIFDQHKKIKINYSNNYVKKIVERTNNLENKLKASYDIFKLNKVFLNHLEFESKKNNNNFITNNEEFKEYEKEFSDDDRDNESEYSDTDDSDYSDEDNLKMRSTNIIKIKSKNSNEIYKVDKENRTCTCPGFTYSRYVPKNCKHVEEHCEKIVYKEAERKISKKKRCTNKVIIEESCTKKNKTDNESCNNYFYARAESDIELEYDSD